MRWTSVDTQEDLSLLNDLVCWVDAQTIQYFATSENEPYFPDDVCRSGYGNKNIHLWVDTLIVAKRYLCMVLIDCDWIGFNMLESLHLTGHVDSLKRITIVSDDGAVALRFSRLIFRFDDVVPQIGVRRSCNECGEMH